jgi:fused signal recognition particle receptor
MNKMGLRDALKGLFSRHSTIDDTIYDDLLDILVEGDFSAALAMETTDKLRALCKKEKPQTNDDVKKLLNNLLKENILNAPVAQPPVISDDGELTLIMLLGVNGVGKTTTAAKLASYYIANSNITDKAKYPVLAAADTFRAAAIDQIKIHGTRLGVRVVAHQSGGDSASVVYDAVEAALASGSALVLADTAGRMHTKTALVEELKKIDRVAAKAAETSTRKLRFIRYLVLDCTTGNNALVQAETFGAAVALDGVVLTKYDSTAKGGIVFSLAAKLKLPVVFLCTGEKYPDIKPFDAEDFITEFIG